jgi:hypothetical protein
LPPLENRAAVAWLQNFRRLVTRYEHSLENFTGCSISLVPSSCCAIYEMGSSYFPT